MCSAYDPLLAVSGEPVGFIADQPFKYLGRKIYATLNETLQRRQTLERLKVLLSVVDGKR